MERFTRMHRKEKRCLFLLLKSGGLAADTKVLGRERVQSRAKKDF
jgi:hypothetical protein